MMNVLVVDDDRLMILVVEAWLRDMGHNATGAQSAEDAIAKLSETDFDFIICDVEMPHMNGFEFVEKVRELKPDWVPITFMSGIAKHEYYQKGIRCGGDFYLLKPLDETIFTAFVTGIERIYNSQNTVKNLSYELEKLRDNTHDGIISITPDGNIHSINNAAAKMFDYSIDQLINQSVSLILPESADVLLQSQSNIFSIKHYLNSNSSEISGLTKLGEKLLLDVSITKIDNGDKTSFFCIMRDITQRKQMEQELRQAAQYDFLTGLTNRALFTDRLEQKVLQYKRNKANFALLFIDVDRFKDINDALGHSYGDEILKLIARRLIDNTRECDTVARLGGDEFSIILDNIEKKQDISSVVQKIQAAFITPFSINHKELTITLSIGISRCLDEEDELSAEALLRQADLAMYKCKELGRNQVYFYSLELSSIHLYRMELSSALAEAAKKMEFSVYYQPQVDASSERITGAEALLRWKTPEAGNISPGLFIPLLEETGLIVPVTEWIIESSMAQWKQWIEAGIIESDSKLSVNISAKSFTNEKTAKLIIDNMLRNGLNSRNFGIEITESVMISDSEKAFEVLTLLKENAICIALDDFGTGYSSLSYLSKFPIDVIKIDHTFIAHSQESIKGRDLVTAIIEMSHKLNLPVVGEGVDTKGKKQFLLDNGCDIFQGFLYAPALSVLDFESFVLNHYGRKTG